MSVVKKCDSKGRLLLGAAFANEIFLVEENESSEMTLKNAMVIPKNELWLYKNQTAQDSLKHGLEQAKQKNFANSPLSNKSMSWLDEIEE